jgi:hypothetical protein
VWFPPATNDNAAGHEMNAAGHETDAARHEVKDIRSGDQVAADPTGWRPPAEDLLAHVVAGSQS